MLTGTKPSLSVQGDCGFHLAGKFSEEVKGFSKHESLVASPFYKTAHPALGDAVEMHRGPFWEKESCLENSV